MNQNITAVVLFTFTVVGAAANGQDQISSKETKTSPVADSGEDQWAYIDNGVIRIGVDKSRGACIGYFGKSGTTRNVLNHYDHGRFIQQSYYGDTDSSNWNGKPWRYNPVQGGSWKGKPARVLKFRIDKDSQLYAMVEPRHWASGKACPEVTMEQWITLRGPIAEIRCRMTYSGTDHRAERHQEMPAVFVDADLRNLVYPEQGKLTRRIPGWPNEPGNSSEDWVAYVNDADWGIGIHTPGTSTFTCYRHEGDGKKGPRGSACSYVAPIRKIRLQQGCVVDYKFQLTPGSLDEIRHRFGKERKKLDETVVSQKKVPNIILFLADDQGWSGTSVPMDRHRRDSKSDFYKTPHLEQLAREGMRFSQGYAPHPNCSPTRMSIQTGKSPARLGSTDIYDVVTATRGFGRAFYQRFYVNKPMKVPLPISGLPKEEITIAEFIKQHRPDYATAHFGKWHMNGGTPSEHGYDAHDGPTSNAEGNAGEPDPKNVAGITRRSIEFIRKQTEAGTPFFLQMSHYAVHTPVLARRATTTEFDNAEPGTVHTNAGYAAMTHDLDSSLGTLLSALDELGIADETYVVYTSDNGGEVGGGGSPTVNTPLAKGKTHTWEGGVRVPLVIRGPGIGADTQCDVPVIGWDFFPTFAELLDIKADLPDMLDGGSLVDILHARGNAVTRIRPEFVWYYPHYRDNKGVRPQAAIRSGNFKLRKEYETGKLMLFNLADDLSESNDLSTQQSELTEKLHQTLEQYLTAVKAKRPMTDPDYDPEKDLGRQGPGIRRGPRADAGN